jgi:DNA-binding transcriptional MerR regulator
MKLIKSIKGKNNKKLTTIDVLSKLTNVRVKVLSSYVRQGILRFRKEDSDGTRYFDRDKATKRIKEIEYLDKQGFTAKEVKNHFLEKDCLEERKVVLKLSV